MSENRTFLCAISNPISMLSWCSSKFVKFLQPRDGIGWGRAVVAGIWNPNRKLLLEQFVDENSIVALQGGVWTEEEEEAVLEIKKKKRGSLGTNYLHSLLFFFLFLLLFIQCLEFDVGHVNWIFLYCIFLVSGWENHFLCRTINHLFSAMKNGRISNLVYHKNNLLHGMIHSNGYKHLIRVKRKERGSKSIFGKQVMDV